MTTLIAFDSETTGVEPGSRVIELAAIAFDLESGDVLDRFERMCDPGMPMPPDTAEFNGITQEMLDGAPLMMHALLDEFSAFLARHPGAPLVAHNAGFDVSILQWAYDYHGRYAPVERDVFCTCEMARAIGATKKNRLVDLVEHYGIERIGDAHRAMSDAHDCMDYFRIVSATAPIVPHMKFWNERAEYRCCYPPSAFGGLAMAVEDGRSMSFTYTDKKGEVTQRTITPYGWALKGDQFMLHGLCHTRNERRTFLADSCEGVTFEDSGAGFEPQEAKGQ